jgi:mono/diheme cytochrome c family protein
VVSPAAAQVDRASAPLAFEAVQASAPESSPPIKVAIGPLPGSPEPPRMENAYLLDLIAIADGQQVYNHFNCAGCHGVAA